MQNSSPWHIFYIFPGYLIQKYLKYLPSLGPLRRINHIDWFFRAGTHDIVTKPGIGLLKNTSAYVVKVNLTSREGRLRAKKLCVELPGSPQMVIFKNRPGTPIPNDEGVAPSNLHRDNHSVQGVFPSYEVPWTSTHFGCKTPLCSYHGINETSSYYSFHLKISRIGISKTIHERFKMTHIVPNRKKNIYFIIWLKYRLQNKRHRALRLGYKSLPPK